MPSPSLSDDFVQWWFAPWLYGGPARPGGRGGELACRDAYRHWCAGVNVLAHMPAHADLQWQDAACRDGERLGHAAELFGGMLAARRQRQDELAGLPPARRQWCLSVALTQPLADWSGDLPEGLRNVRGRGLLELALRLERAFPGMWSRLRLLLPQDLDEQLAPLVAAPAAGANVPLRDRDRRCWLMCMARGAQD
ncbi:hypothetical protein [Pigmentiphaga sp.]|uniref:hypothetical protein n=1 Tax=Pigmentiphaga sp. TaxID=1977564 RepID=UPI0025F016CD|nr:hypothetical protein [Pigmentiphaga sp.]